MSEAPYRFAHTHYAAQIHDAWGTLADGGESGVTVSVAGRIMLSRVQGRIVHKSLDRVSPLAVPVMLEIGRETVYGEASEAVLAEAADDLIREAMG